jgi:hypothetical protein
VGFVVFLGVFFLPPQKKTPTTFSGECGELITPHSVLGTWFESIIWRACTQKHGVFSVGTRLQAQTAAYSLVFSN